jgi:predicted nicotinamide N-methyase
MLDCVVERAAGLELLRPADWELLCERGRDAPYWAIVWPSAPALAAAVARAGRLDGRRVLEVGCGLGLPGVAAARAGAEVLLTDAAPEATVFAAENLARNGAAGEVGVLDLHAPAEALLARGPWDLVLGADVVYHRGHVAPLVALLPRLLAPGGEAWITDPGRPGEEGLLGAARDRFAVASEPLGGEPPVTLHRLRARAADPAATDRD